MLYRITGAALAAAIIVLAGCASEVTRQATDMSSAAPETGKRYTLGQAASFKLDSGYSRVVAADTEFIAVGHIAQGLVLRPTQTVLTVEGKHMHEAYAVVRDNTLVGFYLPVEKAYSPLSQTTSFPLLERKQ
jgi:hypothetical protein